MDIDPNMGMKSTARAVREPDTKDGIFGTWASLWLGFVESSVRTVGKFSLGALGEGSKAIEAAIDFGETAQSAIFRVMRQANRAGFDVAADVVGRSQDAALVVLRVGQETGDRAVELAAQTSHAVVGSRGLDAAPVAKVAA